MCACVSSDKLCLTVAILGHSMRLGMTSYARMVSWDAILKVLVLLLCKDLYVYACVILPMVPDVVGECFGMSQ